MKYLLKALVQTNDENEFVNVETTRPVQLHSKHNTSQTGFSSNNLQQINELANSNNQFQDDNSVCGVPVVGFTQSLVIGGQPAGHGEW